MKLIAELCQNHNGDINILKDMVVKSAESGADIVKIQSIKANSLTKRDEYESFRKYSDEYQRLASLELSIDDELEFIHHAKLHNITPMTTIFSPNHYDYFNSLGYDYLKLSGYSMRAFDWGNKLDKFNFSNGVGYKQTQCSIVKSTPFKLSIHFSISCKCKLDVENTKCLKLNLSNFLPQSNALIEYPLNFK